ncbi:hypothetical protein H5410_030537 [Solanum commersonii]|uniref:RNase H type-1 domain-containing protein n=1 Tax=Solanum commersonii TaxID=4109 RepID=A0A9J5YH66_SOLCO|nr:hypothetical protein H5410_030537 [Solanum commersonii]
MELWIRRNKKKHEGKDLSLSRIIHNVTRSMYRLIKVRRPWMNRNLNNIIIQTYSMLLKKVLTGEWAIPWSISDHILRERNQLVDHLANRAIKNGNCIFTESQSVGYKRKKDSEQ